MVGEIVEERKKLMSIFVRRREAATMLGVSVRMLARWQQEGLLRAVKIGSLVGYDLEDLRRLAPPVAVKTAAQAGPEEAAR